MSHSPKIGAGCAYYGGVDPRHLRGAFTGLLSEGIPLVQIKGCAYPEMARSHIATQAMEFGVDCLLLIDPDVAFDASEARRMAETALKRDAIVSATIGELRSGPVRRAVGAPERPHHVSVECEPWMPERANDLAFAAIPLTALREMSRLEGREYTNTPIKTTGKSKSSPLFSPWLPAPGTLRTPPLDGRTYTNPDRAFLVRAERAGVPIVRDPSIRHQLLSSPGYSVRVHEGSKDRRSEHGIPNFVVCVPTFGAVDLEQQAQIFELEKAGVSVVELHNCPYIDLARSELTRMALEELEADGIFFLDHDIMFRPKDAISLMREAEERQNVVAAVYCMRKSAHSLIGAIDEAFPEPIVFFEGGMVRPSLYSGLGFAAIPKAVVESLAESFPLVNGGFPGDVRPLYALDVNGGYYAGEDVSFCARVQGLTVRHFRSEIVDTSTGAHSIEEWDLQRTANPTGHEVLLDTRVRIFHKGAYNYGIEDHGNVVPRYHSLDGVICRTREEVRATLTRVDQLNVETQARSLGVDKVATEVHPIIKENEEHEKETAAQ